MVQSNEPIACTLTTKEAAHQVLEWSNLRDSATSVDVLETGARMRFPAALESRIFDLVRREATCCAFLTINTVRTDGDLVVEVTSANPEALPVISLLAGLSAT
jgi:hypothetical protein